MILVDEVVEKCYSTLNRTRNASSQCAPGGSLFIRGNMHYDKPSLSIAEQIKLLKSRGIKISNMEYASKHLHFVGYYRLTGYIKHFEISRDKYQVDFEDIISLYKFDKELRLVVLDAIEAIEIAVKSCLTLTLSNEYGAHWFQRPELFGSQKDYRNFIEIVDSEVINKSKCSRDIFINHYYTKYTFPKYPPSWMVLECLTMGTISKLFQSLNREQRKKIAKHFGLDEIILVSWLHILTYIRNVCAHHSRLWDRKLTLKPKIAKVFKKEMANNLSFYVVAFITKVLIKRIGINLKWEGRLLALFNKHSSVIDLIKMGFPKNWEGFV